jgi:hypothetical protein
LACWAVAAYEESWKGIVKVDAPKLLGNPDVKASQVDHCNLFLLVTTRRTLLVASTIPNRLVPKKMAAADMT